MISATLTFPYSDNTSMLQAIQFCDECGWTVGRVVLHTEKSFKENRMSLRVYKTVASEDDPCDAEEAIEILEKDFPKDSEFALEILSLVINQGTDFKPVQPDYSFKSKRCKE